MTIRRFESKGPARRVSPPGKCGRDGLKVLLVFLLACLIPAGCRAPYYRKSADKEAYKIIQAKEKEALGKTNAFTIDTRYSKREAEDIKAKEIIEERLQVGKRVLTLPDALRTAVENSRQYQLQKESLYFKALSLTGARFEYTPVFSAGTGPVTGARSSTGEQSLSANPRVNMATAFKAGGDVTLAVANTFTRYFTGGRPQSEASSISLNIFQPLLRGAGAKIAAEQLTQAERNVIYGMRSFSYYQNTFAYGIVSSYFRILQLQDTVRNQYNNYLSLVRFRERQEALAKDRLPPFQVDQTRQDELRARNTYILAVERYQSSLDDFKVTLGLPLGQEIRPDESALREMEKVGLIPVNLAETEAFQMALDHRLDLLNEIDTFEDRKRQIKVAANNLNPDLNLFSTVSLRSEPTDYAKFNLNDYSLSGGVQLDLPINRLLQRNSYRTALVNFEVQIRTLSLFLDNLKNNVRAGLRSLEQARQTFEIQKGARELADRRVENSEMLLQAGRAQTRDVLEAQNARVSAYNAVTAAIVDYHLTRLQLLNNMGVLKTEDDIFWLKEGAVAKKTPGAESAPPAATSNDLVTPEQLFEK